MDELDALFAGQDARSGQAPLGRVPSRAAPVRNARAASGAPWDDDVPMAPHPSEATSGRQTAVPASRDDRPTGSARLTPKQLGSVLAPSVVRTSVPRSSTAVPQEIGNVSRMPEPHGRASLQEDAGADWRGGEEERAEPGQTRPKEAGRDYFSCHVYGSKAALCFNADTTRGEGHTVRLESAPARGSRSYDWERKVAVQFTVKEMPFVLAVFMGWLPSVQFSAHGPKQDKGFSFEHQDEKVFARVWQGKEAQMAVPVFAEDMFAVVDVLLRQMLKNSPHLGVDGLIAVVRQLAANSFQHRGLDVKKPPAQRSAA
jgi:hypothetical protein